MSFQVNPPVPVAGATVIGSAAVSVALCDLRMWIEAGAEVHVAVPGKNGAWLHGRLSFIDTGHPKIGGVLAMNVEALRYLGGVEEHLIDLETEVIRQQSESEQDQSIGARNLSLLL